MTQHEKHGHREKQWFSILDDISPLVELYTCFPACLYMCREGKCSPQEVTAQPEVKITVTSCTLLSYKGDGVTCPNVPACAAL